MRPKLVYLLLIGISFVVFMAIPAEAQEAGNTFPPYAIISASFMGDEETVREILDAGADKNVRNAFGDTALHVAVYQDNLMIVKLLLDYGFDPDARATRNGNTPLHNAVAVNNIGAVRLLLQYGANKNIKALNGLTPLERARKEEKREIITLLYR